MHDHEERMTEAQTAVTTTGVRDSRTVPLAKLAIDGALRLPGVRHGEVPVAAFRAAV